MWLLPAPPPPPPRFGLPAGRLPQRPPTLADQRWPGVCMLVHACCSLCAVPLPVRALREELMWLHEPGSYVGEVVKVMARDKVRPSAQWLPAVPLSPPAALAQSHQLACCCCCLAALPARGGAPAVAVVWRRGEAGGGGPWAGGGGCGSSLLRPCVPYAAGARARVPPPRPAPLKFVPHCQAQLCCGAVCSCGGLDGVCAVSGGMLKQEWGGGGGCPCEGFETPGPSPRRPLWVPPCRLSSLLSSRASTHCSQCVGRPRGHGGRGPRPSSVTLAC